MVIQKQNTACELTDYFKKNLKKGYPRETLVQALLNQGYSKFNVDKSLKKADGELTVEEQILKKPITKKEILEKIDYPEEKKSLWRKVFS